MNLKDGIKNIKDKSVGLFSFGKQRFVNLSKRNKIIAVIAFVLVLALLLFFVFRGGDQKTEAATYVETEAQKMNVFETIEQSGVVEPFERYEITSLVKGEIVSSPFEEGDTVKEGDTLYQIDDEDAQLNMEKVQMSLDEAYENVQNLNIYAPASGVLTDFSLKVGDNIGAGVIGTISNSDAFAMDIPFSPEDFEKISVGDSVSATSALYMTTLSGRVTYKYSGTSQSEGSGSIVKKVEIEIDNPGALMEGTTFAATVHTSFGDVYSAESGSIENGAETALRAEVSGEVDYIGAKDGDYVKKGQLIARLTNRSVTNSLKNNQISVKSNQKTLDNYNITSPINGTVITKNSKAGDKIDNGNAQTVMMVVADMTKMKFTITVDELDIADVKLGQTAYVDADALPDRGFEAKVTSIASEGTSSGDGVTVFTVELTIDEPGELKSGMNVNANIMINEAYDVVAIPEEALVSTRGNYATVLVKSSGKKADNKEENTKTENNKDLYRSAEKPDEGRIPEFSPGNMPMNDEKKPESSGEQKNIPDLTQNSRVNVPDGYELRQIEIGVSNGTHIEVVSGLSEGEIVAYIPSASSGNSWFGFGGMMGGGMPGGGMPGGGMPGGMPGGGNRDGGMQR